MSAGPSAPARSHVRPFEPGDAAAAAAVLRATFEATYRGVVPDDALDAHLADLDGMHVAGSAGRREVNGGVTFVAQGPDGLVAYAGAGPSRGEADRSAWGELYALYVHPAAQHRGTGRALQRECLEHLRAGGSATADLWVLTANSGARAFYERTGWRLHGATRAVASLGDAEAIRYVRDLPVVRAMRVPHDARAVAEVHVQAWRDAYRGLMPDAFLDGLSVDDREAMWLRLGGDVRAFVAEHDGRAAGFVAVGPCRDRDPLAPRHELWAINLPAWAWGTGAGLALLRTGEAALRDAGATEASLWVLDGNARARRFYEREGWAPDGATQDDERDGFTLREVRYRKSFAPK